MPPLCNTQQTLEEYVLNESITHEWANAHTWSQHLLGDNITWIVREDEVQKNRNQNPREALNSKVY